MKSEDIRRVREAVPFRPFSLVLADGRSFRVPHQDFISIAPKGSALFLWAEDGGIGGILDTTLIAEIRIKAMGGKGSRGQRS